MMEYGFGAIPSPIDIRDYKLNKTACALISLPDTFIVDSIPVKNQGSSPTCIAHAMSEAIEYHYTKQIGTYTRFSTEFIYGCRFEGDYMGDGMYARDALNNAKQYGDVFYSVLSGNSSKVDKAVKNVQDNFEELKPQAFPHRISAYYKVTTINEVKYALVHDGPVLGCMWWYKDFRLDKNNVLIPNKGGSRSGHAVLIVGYDEECFIVQNSWGQTWGNKGLFKIKFDDFDLFFELFGIIDTVIDDNSIIKPKWNDIISKIINSILKFIIKITSKNHDI